MCIRRGKTRSIIRSGRLVTKYIPSLRVSLSRVESLLHKTSRGGLIGSKTFSQCLRPGSEQLHGVKEKDKTKTSF